MAPPAVPPTVFYTSPAGDATDVAVESVSSIIFSQPMDTVSVEEAFSIPLAMSG